MIRFLRLTLALTLITGCAEEAGDRDLDVRSSDADTASTAVGPGSSPQSPSGMPDDEDRGGPEAAVAVIRDYYMALAAGDYARAYTYWANGGEASGQTLAEFESGFAETASVAADIGVPGRIDPAAGSRYIAIPVIVRATTTTGVSQCFRGTYTLRRGVVTGATAEQQQWRIASADLRRREPAECAGVPLGRAPSRPPP